MAPEAELASERAVEDGTVSADRDSPTVVMSASVSAPTEPGSHQRAKADPVDFFSEWDPRL